MKNRVTILVAMLLSVVSMPVMASTWTGGNGNWSSNGSPGWNGTGVPNLAGASAIFTTNGGSGFTVTLDQTAITGSLNYSGSGNGSLSFTLTNALTLNNGGSGASISNASTGTGSRISFGSGSIVLADNLTISNTNTNITGTQSILTGSSTIFSGTGNLTFSNASNSITDGAIVLGGASTFTGNVLVSKGVVTYSSSTTGLGNSSNAITLGSSGNGSASLISTANGSSATLANNVTVASGTGGTLLIGSTGTGAFNSTYSGTFLLNGNLTATSARTGANDVRFTNAISGVGSLTTAGTGNISLRGVNTYTGNTVLGGGQFTLTDNAQLNFAIGATGVNNSISGTANQAAIFDGDFRFDLSGAASNGTWTIVDNASLTETFGSTFLITSTLGTFSESSNIWTLINGGTTYSFAEATGILTATSIPEPSTWVLLAGGLGALLLCRRKARKLQ